MTNTIDDSFIKHFQAEVVTAYQQMGSKLRSTVRSKTDVVGETTTFQVIGKGSAATKNTQRFCSGDGSFTHTGYMYFGGLLRR